MAAGATRNTDFRCSAISLFELLDRPGRREAVAGQLTDSFSFASACAHEVSPLRRRTCALLPGRPPRCEVTSGTQRFSKITRETACCKSLTQSIDLELQVKRFAEGTAARDKVLIISPGCVGSSRSTSEVSPHPSRAVSVPEPQLPDSACGREIETLQSRRARSAATGTAGVSCVFR